MNFEQVLIDHTAALNAHTAALLGSGKLPAAVTAPVKVETKKEEPKKEEPKPAGEPVMFDSLKPRFNKLVQDNRAAAVGLLAEFKIAKLALATLDQYPGIAAALTKAGV